MQHLCKRDNYVLTQLNIPNPEPEHGAGFFAFTGRSSILAGAAIMIPESIEDLITVNQAATLCGVSAVTIRSWAARGTLAASGMDERGRKLYRLIDVAKAERATRDKARR